LETIAIRRGSTPARRSSAAAAAASPQVRQIAATGVFVSFVIRANV
jgi:hypothetical protein